MTERPSATQTFPGLVVGPGNAPSSAKPGQPSKWAVLSVRLGFLGFLVGVWQLLSMYGPGPVYLRPGPVEVAKVLWGMLLDKSILHATVASAQRIIIGYSISVVGGLALGVALARSWVVKQTIGSLILSLQSLPSICWLPFALIWIGLNEKAILAVVILGALFAIAISAESALRNIPPLYIRVGLTLGAKRWSLWRDILLFAALPELIGGLKVGWTFAWRSLMAAELIRQDVIGVARLLDTGRQLNDMPMMIASILVILTLGLTVDLVVFGNLERMIRRRWGLEK